MRSPEEVRAPTGSNPSGCKKGYGFSSGKKPLKRRTEAVRVLVESAKVERRRGNSFSIAREEQNFERGSPGVWGAEKGFHALEDYNSHRAGSQTRG